MKKLIKKFTLVDYLLILSIFIAIAGYFLLYSKETVTLYVSTTNVSLDWMEDPMPPYYWYSNSLKVGDKAYHVAGGEIAEILSIDNSEWGGQRRFSKLNLKVQALYNIRSKIYLLKDEPLLVGNEISLNFGDVAYKGIITYVDTKPEDSRKKLSKARVEIFIQELHPWLAETYNKDFLVKNIDGETIFKITSSKITPTERSLPTDDGRLVRAKDPYYKDVNLQAEMMVTCSEDVCYYNDIIPLKTGGKIRVSSNTGIIEEKAIIKSFELLK